jgi:hypothetical protein
MSERGGNYICKTPIPPVQPQKIISQIIIGDIDIQKTIIIDIHDTYARAPLCRLQARDGRDILEYQRAFIDIEPAADHAAAKEQVGQSVIIEIAHTHARAVVHVFVHEHVERIAFRDRIAKADMRPSRAH